MYCPRGFILPNDTQLKERIINHLKESFDDDEILIQQIKECEEAMENAKICMSDQMCKDFSYDLKKCKTHMNEEVTDIIITCIKELEGEK